MQADGLWRAPLGWVVGTERRVVGRGRHCQRGGVGGVERGEDHSFGLGITSGMA